MTDAEQPAKRKKSRRPPGVVEHLAWRAEALGYDVLNAGLRALPVDRASALGGWMMRRLGPLSSADRYARQNIAWAFPELTGDRLEALVRAQWDNVGRTFAELPIMDRIWQDPARVEVVGAERLAAIRDREGPAVFIGGHFANWELMAAVIVNAGVPAYITYRPANNPYVDQRIKESRARYGIQLFAPKGESARDLMQAIRRGQSIALMVDQKFTRGFMVPFFGRPAPTNPGAVRIAHQLDAPLVTMACERLEGARFRVTVGEPYRVPRTGDRAADVEAGVRWVNGFIEAEVRAHPGDWFWPHRRWAKADYRRPRES